MSGKHPTGLEQKRQAAKVARDVAARFSNQRRAAKQARVYLTDAWKAWSALVDGERGHVVDELKTALRGIGHMLDDIESGKDGDEP